MMWREVTVVEIVSPQEVPAQCYFMGGRLTTLNNRSLSVIIRAMVQAMSVLGGCKAVLAQVKLTQWWRQQILSVDQSKRTQRFDAEISCAKTSLTYLSRRDTSLSCLLATSATLCTNRFFSLSTNVTRLPSDDTRISLRS